MARDISEYEADDLPDPDPVAELAAGLRALDDKTLKDLLSKMAFIGKCTDAQRDAGGHLEYTSFTGELCVMVSDSWVSGYPWCAWPQGRSRNPIRGTSNSFIEALDAATEVLRSHGWRIIR